MNRHRLLPFRLARLLLGISLVVACAGWAVAEPRLALVIGNGAYADMPLANPANDAQDLSAALSRLGFAVTSRTNLGRSEMNRVIKEFAEELARQQAVGLFYFAGHGVQVRGKNYLLPVGQRFEAEADVEADAVDANWVLARLEDAGNPLNLLILDACRNNPLRRSGRSAARGLARMEAPSGALIAFAAQAGAEASDVGGRNGLYTKYLLQYISTPGLPVEQVFKRVRVDVEQASGLKQSPEELNKLRGDFYFVPPASGSAGTQVASLRPEPARPAPMPPPSSAPRSEDPETQFWSEVKASGAKEYYEAYVKQYPKGKYVALAKVELKKLEDQEKTQKAREAAEVQRLQREAAERERAEAARLQAEAARQKADEARQRAEAERLARVAPKVRVKDAWVRNTKPARKSTCAFMEITSSDEAALLSAASPAAGVVEIHTLKMEDGVMKMRRIPKLDLPAGKGVTLQPGGYCIWLTELKQQMNMGDVVPITLKIEGKDKKVQTVEIKADVR